MFNVKLAGASAVLAVAALPFPAQAQPCEGKTIIMVEQNAKKGLEFADIGYVLVSGTLAMAGRARALLADPEVGRLFLGG